MSDLEGRYFRRIQVLEAERDELKREIQKRIELHQMSIANAYELADHRGKLIDTQTKEIEKLSHIVNGCANVKRILAEDRDSWKAKAERMEKALREMVQISYFDEAEGPELRAQNAALHRLAKAALPSEGEVK